MLASPSTERRMLWVPGVLILLFAFNNFIVGPLLEALRPNNASFILAVACVGLVGAQLAAHAVWCVFAPYSRVRRIGVAVGTAAALIGVWGLGMVLTGVVGTRHRINWEAIRILLCLPLLVVAIQSPLWAAKYWLRWRIILSSSACEPMPSRAVGIRDLLIAVAIGAGVLSAARLAVPLDTPTEQFLLPMVIVAAILALVSLSTTVPIMLITLRARRLAWAFATLLLYSTVFTWAAVWIFVTMAQQDTLLLRFNLTSIFGTYFLGLTACMLLARAFGWRLAWNRTFENEAEK
jgi:hypothetical protein